MGVVTIGIDIGQRRDPTTIVAVEREERMGPADRPPDEQRKESHHTVRHLERMALGTPYPEVADRLAEIAARVAERTTSWLKLYLDATGVGQPVADVLRQRDVRAEIIPVYFTYGDRRNIEQQGQITLGKAWLVSRLQALFQGERLHLPPDHPEAETLVKELLDYEIRVDPEGNDKYGAFRVGTHDDLVTALGLATQADVNPFAEAMGKGMRYTGGLPASRRPVRGAARRGRR
jgi:hypothetical protein